MKWKLNQLILLALATDLTQQVCQEGCLGCDQNNQCTFCDYTKNYYKVNGTCVSRSIDNCKYHHPTLNECSVCRGNYYVDSNTRSCTPVPEGSIIQNCEMYNSVPSCQRCMSNYYISGAQCVAVTTTIPKCVYYDTSVTCETCEPDYILSFDKKSCIQKGQENNCLGYSQVECKKCKADYDMNKNYLFQHSNKTELFMEIFVNQIRNKSKNYIDQQCQPTIFMNCLERSSYTTCKKCLEGYYLLNNKCLPKPVPVIDKCHIYTSNTECKSCEPGYHLTLSNQCMAVTQVDDCMVYSSTATTTQCLKCSSGKYAQSDLVCAPRVDSLDIAKCEEEEERADKCKTCEQGYQITNDGLACLQTISKCMNYNSSSRSTVSHTCSKCMDGYYLDNLVCVAGTKRNCKVYETTQDVCMQCENRYYLNAGSCEESQQISNCSTYSGTQANTCTACDMGFFPFQLVNDCQNVTTINNCRVYSNKTTCSECMQGYYLDSNACPMIPETGTGMHCKIYNGATQKCTECKDGFFLQQTMG